MGLAPIQFAPGVQRFATPYDRPNNWWDSNLVRWQAGNLLPVGGWDRFNPNALGAAVRKIHSYRDNSGLLWTLAGLQTGIRQSSGGAWTTITPTGFTDLTSAAGGGYGSGDYGEETYGTPRTASSAELANPKFWCIENWGQEVLALANSDGRLLHWSPATPTTIMDVPSNAPTGNNAMVVIPERHVLLFGDREVRWSDRENYNNWNYASTTSLAGTLPIETATPITQAITCKEGTLVFSNREVYLLRYIGAPFVIGREYVGKTTFRSPNALARAGNRVVWLGDEGFWVWTGGGVQPLDCPLWADINQDMNTDWVFSRAHMSDNGSFPEVWFFYPSNASFDGECDKYVIWNYAEGWWARGSLARTAMFSPGPLSNPIMSGTDQFIYRHESGWSADGATRVGQVWVESSVLYADQAGDGANVKTINQALIGGDFDSPANYRIRFYSRMTPNGTERVWGPYSPRADGYTDCRVTARDIRFRLEATSDAYWSIGQVRLDIIPTGGKR
jgi:hypothetical protein